MTFLGYTKHKMQTTDASDQEDQPSEVRAADQDGFEDDDNECKGLLMLWRFDEDLCPDIKDTTDNGIRGLIKGNSYRFEAFHGDNPMEDEDKWGKQVSEPHFLEISPDTHISTEKKEWSRREVKQLCFEMWFCPREDKGILLSTSDESIILMYKNCKYILMVNQQKVPVSEQHIKLNVWHNISLHANSSDRSLQLYHDGIAVVDEAAVDFSLKKVGKGHLMVVPQFAGGICEVRLWKRCRPLEEVKSNMYTPLSIVSEKMNIFVINIKQKNSNKEDIHKEEFDFAFSDSPEDAGWAFATPANDVQTQDDWSVPPPPSSPPSPRRHSRHRRLPSADHRSAS